MKIKMNYKMAKD